MPRTTSLALIACAALATPLAGSTANATAADNTSASAHASGMHNRGDRVGGTVRKAWPRIGSAPRKRQARWLARQVGATKQRPCARQRSKARSRCHLSAASARAASADGPAATLSAATGDPGAPRGPVARLAAASAGNLSGITLPLQLVRSYAIPADDPAYKRLLNWSWTYDSAVAAAAFATTGDKANSAQLLDQLAALQYDDGSLEIAFNTKTGEGARIFRAGTVAWFGLAASAYDQAFDSNRYLDSERRTAEYLLTAMLNIGVITGGPDVKWASTQHNLISYGFFSRLSKELRDAGDAKAADRYATAAKTIGDSIDENLLVVDKDGARFRQGLQDDGQAVDVQALGAMYLKGRGKPELAAQVLEYAQQTFAVGDRSVELSNDTDTFNMSYEAKGPFTGFAPYAGEGVPNVRWAEASAEMRLAQAALGQDTSASDKSIERWAAITNSDGPLQADRSTKADGNGTEYHVWPAATAAAWTVLAQTAPAFFAAPLPPKTTLVSDWAKVRGGNLITTYTDGRVEMVSGAERRVLAGSATGTDYTVTANTSQSKAGGYGVYVRATVDSASKLTAYCVQVDHGYGKGEIVIREILNDVELAVPIARGAVATDFSWYDATHVVGVTVKGNTMNVTLDGAQQIAVPDLAAASAKSVEYAYPGKTMSPPLAGGYGLRGFGAGTVSLQQMTLSLLR